MQLVVIFYPSATCRRPAQSRFSAARPTLSVQLGRQIAKPFWIDTVGRSNLSRSGSSSTTP